MKSMKTHLRKIVGNIKLTFEELSTLLTQIEACLNSRPLVPLPSDDDGIEALTPGHFLIGQPLQALLMIPLPTLILSPHSVVGDSVRLYSFIFGRHGPQSMLLT